MNKSILQVSIGVNGKFHAFELAAQLDKAGYLNQLISTYMPNWINNNGINFDKYVSIFWLYLLKQGWRRLPGKIKGNRNPKLFFNQGFDAQSKRVLSNQSNLFVGWAGSCLQTLRFAKKLGIPTIVDRGSSHMDYHFQVLAEEHTAWNIEFNKIPPGLRRRQLAEYNEADYIAIPSSFVKKTFIDAGISDSKLIQIPYGVNLRHFYPVPKEDDVFRIIFCGRLELQKGVQYLLQAFCELDLPNTQLWLIGSCEPEFRNILAKYENDKIVIKGYQPQKQLKWFYSQGSVFCLPSVQDGFGMVIPQAMACGLPVIHSTNTGGADIVRPGIDGFSIPIRDVAALKDCLLFLYENPDRQKEMSQNALQQVTKSFTWDDYGDAMIKAYKKVISA